MSIVVDTREVEEVFSRISKLAPAFPVVVRNNLEKLSEAGVRKMQEAVEPNRYTGALSDSISGEIEDGGLTLVISPKAYHRPSHGLG